MTHQPIQHHIHRFLWLPMVTLMLAWTATAAASDHAAARHSRPIGDPAFIKAGATLQRVVDGDQFDIVFTEGPAVGCDGKVYFTDITPSNQEPSQTPRGGILAGAIWTYNPRSGRTKVFRSPSGMANGLMFDAQCNLISAEGADFGGRRITRTNMRTGRAEMAAGLYDDLPFNSPNDLAIDEQGRIYFSDPRYMGDEPILHDMAVYRIDQDGSVHQLITDIAMPNGLAISPDQTKLYVVETGSREVESTSHTRDEDDNHDMGIVVYDLDRRGRATYREMLVQNEPALRVDGLAVDREGNVWAAVQNRSRQGIYAYTPQGEEMAYIPTPERPRNVTFGRGRNSRVLYITAGNDLYQIDVNKRGYHLPFRLP